MNKRFVSMTLMLLLALFFASAMIEIGRASCRERV